MPVSFIWFISSALTLAFACICPMAVVRRLIPSSPIPSAAALSPIAVKIGITCCALNPNASKRLEAFKSPGSSNGVAAAKRSNSAKKSFAKSALFKSVVKAFSVCSICAALRTATAPNPAKAALKPATPAIMFSLISMALPPSFWRIVFCTLAISFCKPFVLAPISTCKLATVAIFNPLPAAVQIQPLFHLKYSAFLF